MSHENTPWSAFDAQGHALDCDGWRASHDGNGSTAHMPIKDASGEVVALVVMKSENHDWLDPKPLARLIVDAVNAQAAAAPVDALAEVYRLAANMPVRAGAADVRDMSAAGAFRAGALAMRSAIADAIAAKSEAEWDARRAAAPVAQPEQQSGGWAFADARVAQLQAVAAATAAQPPMHNIESTLDELMGALDLMPICGKQQYREKLRKALAAAAAPVAPPEREPWLLYLSDRADGVKGRYAIARWHPAGYREVWNLRKHCWSSFSDDVLTLEQAQDLLRRLTIPTAPAAAPVLSIAVPTGTPLHTAPQECARLRTGTCGCTAYCLAYFQAGGKAAGG